MAVVTSASEHLQSETETEPEEGVEAHTHTGTISDEEELFALKGEGRNNPDGINEDEAAPDPEPEPGSSKWAWAAGGIFLAMCIVLLSVGGTSTYRYSVVASKTQGAKNVDVAASIEDEVEEDCGEDANGRRQLDIDSGVKTTTSRRPQVQTPRLSPPTKDPTRRPTPHPAPKDPTRRPTLRPAYRPPTPRPRVPTKEPTKEPTHSAKAGKCKAAKSKSSNSEKKMVAVASGEDRAALEEDYYQYEEVDIVGYYNYDDEKI